MNPPWLERELARQLAPVCAPDSLWHRVCCPQPCRNHSSVSARIFWLIAAAMVPFAVVGVLRLRHVNRDPGLREIAALVRAPGPLDFRSADFAGIRSWVKSTADIDIDLPRSGSQTGERTAVRVIGARLVHLDGLPYAAIDYRIGDESATLLVSGKRTGLSANTIASRHLFSQIESDSGSRLFTWKMRNETYAVAYTGAANSRAACLLCHANAPGV